MSDNSVYLVGAGIAFPPNYLTNEDIGAVFGLSQKTVDKYANLIGIRGRYSLCDMKNMRMIHTNDVLAGNAAKDALDSAGMKSDEIDCVITACSGLDYIMPSVGSRLLKHLDIERVATFDLYGGCAAFMQGITQATNFIRSGFASTVLVTASESITSMIRMIRYPVEAFLFGDAGAAFILSSLPREGGDFPLFEVQEVAAFTDQKIGDEEAEVIVMPINGYKVPFDVHPANDEFDARITGRFPHEDPASTRLTHNAAQAVLGAVPGMLDVFRAVTKHADVELPGIIVPHQGSGAVLGGLAANLPEGWDYVDNFADRGNLSTASCPVAFYEHLERIRGYKSVAMCGIGTGATMAGALLRPL